MRAARASRSPSLAADLLAASQLLLLSLAREACELGERCAGWASRGSSDPRVRASRERLFGSASGVWQSSQSMGAVARAGSLNLGYRLSSASSAAAGRCLTADVLQRIGNGLGCLPDRTSAASAEDDDASRIASNAVRQATREANREDQVTGEGERDETTAQLQKSASAYLAKKREAKASATSATASTDALEAQKASLEYQLLVAYKASLEAQLALLETTVAVRGGGAEGVSASAPEPEVKAGRKRNYRKWIR